MSVNIHKDKESEFYIPFFQQNKAIALEINILYNV